MFKTRLISGIILVILAVLFICLGGNVLLSVTALISLIGMFEIYRVFKIEKEFLSIVGYIAAIIFYLNLHLRFIPDILIFVFGFMIVLMFVYVFSYPKYNALMGRTVYGCRKHFNSFGVDQHLLRRKNQGRCAGA